MSFRKHGVGLESMIRAMREEDSRRQMTCFFLTCNLDFKPVVKTAGRVLRKRKGTRRRKKCEIVEVRMAGAHCVHA